MKKKRIIRTNNREIYEKFNMLNFSREVVLQNTKCLQLKKILTNINKKEKILVSEPAGKYIIVKKVNPLNFNIYMQKKY